GTVWQVSDVRGRPSATCVKGLPVNFNPSPYFAEAKNALFFGAGGNTKNVHWGPLTGFYDLMQQSGSVTIARVSSGAGTVNHLSANDGILSYTTDGERNIRVSGLGTYNIAQNEWNFFPSTTFLGQSGNGVTAVSDGAWFTSSGNCGDWKGTCL